MGFKFGFVLGVAVGLIVATRLTAEQMQRLETLVEQAAQDRRVAQVRDTVSRNVSQVADAATARVTGKADEVSEAVADTVDEAGTAAAEAVGDASAN